MEKKYKDISFIRTLEILIPMVFKASPKKVVISIVFFLMNGVSFPLVTLATQKFLDNITEYVSDKLDLNIIFLSLSFLCFTLIFQQFANGIGNFFSVEVGREIKGKISYKLNLKSSKLNAIDFENPELLNDINKAEKGLENGINLVFIMLLMLTGYVPYFIFMECYLYKLNSILATSIVVIAIPLIISQLFKLRVYSRLEDKVAPYRREYEYYEKCIISNEYFKETRILGAFSYFMNLYTKSLERLNKSIWNSEKRTGMFEIIMDVITLCGYMGVLILLIISLVRADITVGAFGAVFSSIDVMFGIIQEMVGFQVGNIVQSLGTVRNFIRFLYIEERKGKDIEIEEGVDITLSNVSFSYPYVNRNSLNDINLKIKSKEIIAIVGENGSGKSTLVKLIMGLYSPTKGQVLLGEIDASNINQKYLYKNISAVFQKFQRYKMSLKNNINISNKKIEDNIEKIKDAINKADLEIMPKKFPQGYETMLSKEFGGIDLSGGQWQRVAIARAFYRRSDIIILDEPTAAIDPVEESKIYTKFSEMSKGKTAILVTHRLGSAKIADRIVVLDNGRIVQVGKHDELINVEGKYKKMYEAQSKWYVADKESKIYAVTTNKKE